MLQGTQRKRSSHTLGTSALFHRRMPLIGPAMAAEKRAAESPSARRDATVLRPAIGALLLIAAQNSSKRGPNAKVNAPAIFTSGAAAVATK